MQPLRRSHRLARLVAGWILVWLAAMQASAFVRAGRFDPLPVRPVPVASVAAVVEGAEHAAHHHHASSAPAEDEAADEPADSGHPCGHLAQCPGCLFATAPPPPPLQLPPPAAADVPTPVATGATRPHGVGVLPPPARAPPALA
jgi:hypothetical protein